MKIHRVRGYIQCIYLVEYTHGILLLDGCCRADVPVLRRFFRDILKRPLSDLSLVVVTHMHPDHAGAAHKLRSLTGCHIAAANIDTHWYRGFSGWLMHLTDIALATWVAGRLGQPRKNLWYPRKLDPDIKLNDGDLLPDFPEWQAVSTPGHTDRDVSLWHLPSHRIYVADVIVKVKNKFIPPFPIFHPNKYRASVNKIIRLNPKSILLAHGGEVSLSTEQYEHLTRCAPALPKTHWRATKARVKQALLLKAG